MGLMDYWKTLSYLINDYNKFDYKLDTCYCKIKEEHVINFV
jgi:hypothetical protein